MQRNIKSVVVNDQMALLLRLSRATGVAPVHIAKCSNNYRVTLSRKYGSYNIALGIVVSLIHISYCLLMFGFKYDSKIIIYSTLAKALKGVQVFVNLYLAATTTLNGLKRMDRFITYLNKIKEINQSLDNVYTNIRFKKRTMISFGILLLFHLIFTVRTTYDLLRKSVKVSYIIKIIICLFEDISSYVPYFTIGVQYIFIICLVKATFKVFKDRFRSLAVEDSPEVYSLVAARTRIQLFYVTYASLCNLVFDINNQDGLALMLLFISQLLRVFISIPSIMTVCLPEISSVTHNIMCWLVFALLLHESLKLIVLIEPCHRIQQETEEVQSVVSEVLRARRDLSSELNCFMSSFQLYSPAICPFDILNFTRGLVFGVLGVAATFLIMISQFHIKDTFTDS